jgi:adenylyltransferase/sulfurtransferase
MAVKLRIPTPLRTYAGDQDSIQVEGTTINEVLETLTAEYPNLKKHLYSEDGQLRSFVNIYLNDEDIRYLEKEDTAVSDGDTISIVPSIAGGSTAYALPSQTTLSNEEIHRYSRHLIIPEVGMNGQRKLKEASVLCIGAGGLGSPVTMYLAAAGVGHLGIVDFDIVDFSNLQRQIIHSTDRVGKSKIESAKATLMGINPNVFVETYETALTSENAFQLFDGYDLIVDGTDNFPTRYLVNDACVLSRKPNVYASIFRFEGQASVFATEDGPCYRCLYPEPPPPGLVPSCAEGGVLGILPGLVGLIQATEAVKLILGIGEPLIGRLLLVEALGMEFRELKLRKDPECPVCGEHPTVRELIDYNQFCGVVPDEGALDIPQISSSELRHLLDHGEDLCLLDVRTPQEYEICRIEGAQLIPLNQLMEQVHRLDTAQNIVVHCKTGIRSLHAIQQLQQAGFKKLTNLQGGIIDWVKSVDPSLPVY